MPVSWMHVSSRKLRGLFALLGHANRIILPKRCSVQRGDAATERRVLGGWSANLTLGLLPACRDLGQSAHYFVKLLSRNLGFFNIVAEDFTNYGR